MSDRTTRLSLVATDWRFRLGLFLFSAITAGYIGFVAFSVSECIEILRHGAYYVILSTFVLWGVALYFLFRKTTGGADFVWTKGRAAAVGAITLLTVLTLSQETFRSKILYDEYVLQSTAYNMHFFRENAAMVRGYDIQGVFLSTDSYVDKRPVFFPFLLSLLHDLGGYRPQNVYVLNAGLFVISLGLAGWIGWKLNSWRGGLLAIGLLGSLPLFAQNASGAGMELLNVCMLLAVVLHAVTWLRQPEAWQLSALVLGTILLVQSRYESAVYVLPTGILILLGWWRRRRVLITGPVVAAPLLLVPVAIQQKVVSNSPIMWELHENQTSRFSVDYLYGNLQGAFDFMTAGGVAKANSLLLTGLGMIALVVVGWRIWRGRNNLHEQEPIRLSLLLYGAAMLAITAMIMFYYWASLDDPMASRFALPLHVVLVFMIVAAAAWADRRWPVTVVLLVAVAVFTLGVSSPKQAYHFYSHLGTDEIEWEKRMVAARPHGSRLILTNKSPLPWLIDQTPSILLGRSLSVADRLAEQLQMPDFAEILVMQGARPASAKGDYQLPPDEVLPTWFQLELVAERRFGTKLARISRLVAVNLPEDYKPSTPPAVTSEVALPAHPAK